MANYRAVANGNWNTGSTWAGGAVPPNGEGHNIYSNNFTVTIDQNVDVALITNAAITASFVGGGTSAAVGGGFSVINSGYTITANTLTNNNASPFPTVLTNSATGTTNLNVATISGYTTTGIIRNTSSGTLNIVGATIATNNPTINNVSTGIIAFSACNLTGHVSDNGSPRITNSSTGQITLTNSNLDQSGTTSTSSSIVNNLSTGSVSASNCNITGSAGSASVFTITSASGFVNMVNSNLTASVGSIITTSADCYMTNCTLTASSTRAACINNGTTRFSGTIINATNGQQALYSPKFIMFSQPSNAYIQHALDGVNSNSFTRFYTADNGLGQANPTDVRSGVSYASGNLTGRLTVPARGSVSLNVNYGPSMTFTATRSGTTATATLAYSYPLVVGDQITVTGASNTEWDSTYTIASVVSGTSVTFVVPATHSANAGTGALMQTTGTAVLDPTAVASAVWGAETRTLTTSSGPTAVEIRQELDSNSTKLANLDATVSSRLAPSGTLATVTTLTNKWLHSAERRANCRAERNGRSHRTWHRAWSN
jgi:hypothetical protein